jgi:hypothetical protein
MVSISTTLIMVLIALIVGFVFGIILVKPRR